ncbi:type VI secretion system-associated FHA domain protein [Xenorhabdus santafensis]|nr:type VI secretion system-associated FHA domain protein [Xenorhabdus sp. 12]
MRFTIVKNSGTDQPAQLSYDFTPPGGTIGRSKDNNWVLPDEELSIARLQAIVSISADGECWIVNRGSSSEILLNMIPLRPERQVEIRGGDTLKIGNYQIQVTDIAKNSQASGNHAPENHSEAEIPNGVWENLEHMFTTANTLTNQSTSDQSIADHSINEQTVPGQSIPEKTAIANTAPALIIPHKTIQELNNNNPLIKEQQSQERNPSDPLAHIESITDLEALQTRSTDPMAMFNSDATFQQESIFSNHTPTTLIQPDNQPLDHQDVDKKSLDPLALFSDTHARNTNDDNPLSEVLNNAVPLNSPDDTATAESQSTLEPTTSTSLFDEPVSDPKHSVTQDASSQTSSLPPLFTQEKPRESTFSGITEAGSRTFHENFHENYDHKITETKPKEKLPEEDLIAALLEGMGLQNLSKLPIDRQIMHQLGALIHQLSQGVIALNESRNLFKRKIKLITGTNPTSQDVQNPFELLSSAQSVLSLVFNHILGFIPLEQATHDILTELQAHQAGIIAGVQAVEEDKLHLFNPSLLEQQAKDEGRLPRLALSSTHKALMWDYFIKHYQTAINQSEQDSALFGENFLRAYETEVERYKHTQHKDSKNKAEK